MFIHAYSRSSACRKTVFAELLAYLGCHSILESCPPVLIAYLGVLRSLASDHKWAQAVYGQLGNSGSMYATLSWSRLFDIMKTYCVMYSQGASQVGLLFKQQQCVLLDAGIHCLDRAGR